jgi:hypothetical protein
MKVYKFRNFDRRPIMVEIEVSLDTEEMYKRACELLGERDPGVLTFRELVFTWHEIYESLKDKKEFTEGALERGVALLLGMDEKAARGFVVTRVDIENNLVTLADLEQAGIVDLSEEEDSHNIPYVEAFRQWVKSQPRSIKS